jgi:hypothetical protein
MPTTPNQIAREMQAKEIVARDKRWQPLKWLLGVLLGFILGTFIGQPVVIFFAPSRKATLSLTPLRDRDCICYSLVLGHARTIDSAEISIRFPQKVDNVLVKRDSLHVWVAE